MLSAAERVRVVSIGDPRQRNFSDVCSTLGLTIEHVSTPTIDVSAADLLAIVLVVDNTQTNKAAGHLIRLISQNALEYGVLLVAMSADLKSATDVQSRVIEAVNSGKNPRLLQPRIPDIVAIGLTEKECDESQTAQDILLGRELARVLRSHETECPANLDLTIDGDKFSEFWEQDEILLRRAFHDFTKITLRSETGGRSANCTVWRIAAQKGSDVLEPFVAKAAQRDDLQREFYTYRDMVRDHVPFPFRAPCAEHRFVRGGSRALLVSVFVARAQRFDDYLSLTTHPELPVATLFHNALSNWRKSAVLQREMSLAAHYLEQQKSARDDSNVKALLPDPTSLEEAYESCQSRGWKATSPKEVWELLESLPKESHYIAGVHGDLNVRNIFVRWNVSDTILIDFSHSGQKDSLARDPAKLETSIALTCRSGQKKLLSGACLKKLYKAPLLPLREQIAQDSRIEAIRQIRRQAGGEGISNSEYALVVACHLLRYASHSPGALVDKELAGRRAIAYSLANSLIASLASSKKVSNGGSQPYSS